MEKETCNICLEAQDVVVFAYSCDHWVCTDCYRHLRDYCHFICPLCSSISLDPIRTSGGYQIFVRNTDCRTLLFHVSPSKTTVEDLKYLVYCITNIAPNDQRLNFNGKILENNRLVCGYSVETGSTLHLVQQLRGD